MPFPVYLHFGPVTIHPHLLFEAIAYSVGFRSYLALRKSRGDSLDAPHRWWIVASATSGALFGAILLAALENPRQWLQDWHTLHTPFAGKTIVGALIGGVIVVELAKLRLGIRRRTGDLFAIPLCIGIAIGRIGCFLTGLEDQTSGVSTSLPWGANFGDGTPRHPAQLYEILFLIFLMVLIVLLSRRSYMEGDLFRLFMAGYLSFRLLIEFLKSDPPVLFGLSSVQLACLCMLAFYSRDVPRLLRELSSGVSAHPIVPQPSAPEISGITRDLAP